MMQVTPVLFAPGAGGNWLIHAINNMPMNHNGTNFHRHTWSKHSVLMQPTHNIPSDRCVFFHGDLTLNFFLNSIFKFWFKENQAGDDQTWFLNKMLRNWAVIVSLAEFDNQKPDFSWSNLLYDPGTSYQQLTDLQQRYNQNCMTLLDFMHRRQCLFDTMLPTHDVYENWHNDFWVLAVLADLRCCEQLSADWQFESNSDWNHYRSLAQDLYHHCRHIRHHQFQNDLQVPHSVAQCMTQKH